MNVYELENDHKTTTVNTTGTVERILDEMEYIEQHPLLWDSNEDQVSPMNMEFEEAILFIADGHRGRMVYDGIAKFGDTWYFLDLVSEGVMDKTDLTDELVAEIKKSTGISYA